jgi:hypothetical protein
MATRGQIAYLADPNTIFSIYVNYESDNLNRVLPEYYNSESEAESLVMDGNDIRVISSDDGEIERYDKGGAVKIKGEDPSDLFNYLYDHSRGNSAQYVSVWLEDKWITLNMNKGRQYFIGTLLDQMRKTEPTMEMNSKVDEEELNEHIKRQWQHRAGIIK